MGGGPPAGPPTFLVTAASDSSRRWGRTPEESAAGFERYAALAEDAAGRHGGLVVASGDNGMTALFTTAVAAAEAAMELQAQALEDHDRIGFGVQVGLHTGQPDTANSRDVEQEAARAARLTSIAHGGQILVSETTEAKLRERVALRKLGEYRLDDLDPRMSVYQLTGDGLPADFPALRSPARWIGELPEQLTSLVGRDALIVEIADLVRSNPLVTLGGVGGVGKTRLALEVGAGIAKEFPDGVWVVELASVSDSSSVTAAIATTLGILPRGSEDLLDTVADVLSQRRTLLVVDNCEHVLPAASAAITAILARSRDTRILATSREYLWIADEALVEVPPLALSGGDTSDAVRLFVDRARAVRPTFGLSDPQAGSAVAEICHVLDGLPLGIELAAAHMAAMSPKEVRDRLAARFRL